MKDCHGSLPNFKELMDGLLVLGCLCALYATLIVVHYLIFIIPLRI